MEDRTNSQYRAALSFLYKREGCTIKELAKQVGCSARHLQGILSEKERKGIRVKLGGNISAHYGLSYVEMLNLGQCIIDEGDPEEWFRVREDIKNGGVGFSRQARPDRLDKLAEIMKNIDKEGETEMQKKLNAMESKMMLGFAEIRELISELYGIVQPTKKREANEKP